MPYLIYAKVGEPAVYMVTPQEMAGDLNTVLPVAPTGTIATLCGGAVKKQKDINGNWNEEGQMPTPDAVFTATGATTGTLSNVMSAAVLYE